MIRRYSYLIALVLCSCGSTEIKSPELKYFDLKSFFESEIKHLTDSNILVNKTISQNGISESKTNLAIDWKKELDLFISSDINKSAWRDSYKTIKDSLKTSYYAIESNLRTREIHIEKNLNGITKQIIIKNISKNHLIESSEILVYMPNNKYRIEKKQDVIFLGKTKLEVEADIIN
jgi:hypothetical protein